MGISVTTTNPKSEDGVVSLHKVSTTRRLSLQTVCSSLLTGTAASPRGAIPISCRCCHSRLPRRRAKAQQSNLHGKCEVGSHHDDIHRELSKSKAATALGISSIRFLSFVLCTYCYYLSAVVAKACAPLLCTIMGHN